MSVWDELHFGSDRILNLREGHPSGPAAVRRADGWLREQQIAGAGEVLVITGRGSHSVDGIAIIRPAIGKLLSDLKRQGVVASYREHNPGAFAVQLAPLRAMLEAPNRRRGTKRSRPAVTITGLSQEANDLLRQLAERSLEALGVQVSEQRTLDEMHRHLGAIAASLGSGGDVDARLCAAISSAIADYD